jgi:hypothetical protein
MSLEIESEPVEVDRVLMVLSALDFRRRKGREGMR